MSDADDLRTAIALVLVGSSLDPKADADLVLALLADPVRRLAILDAMGLDVIGEGRIVYEKDQSESDGWRVHDEGYAKRWGLLHGTAKHPVLVVRPRGEAT